MAVRPILVAATAAIALSGCGTQAAAPPKLNSEKPAAGPTQNAAAKDLPTPAEGSAAVAEFAAKGRPIYCGGRKRPWIALTFDDGPGPYSKHVLALLKRAQAPATFFDVGRNVAPYRSSLVRENSSGAAIGNHSWSHPVLPSLSAREQRAQLANTRKAISRVTGEPVRLFRPPYAERDKTTDRISRSLKMATILWDVDSRDALGASSKQIARRVKNGFHAGAIVLLHENRGQTVRALRYTILPALKKSGLTPVTIPQMLAGNPPTDSQLRRGRGGCTKRR